MRETSGEEQTINNSETFPKLAGMGWVFECPRIYDNRLTGNSPGEVNIEGRPVFGLETDTKLCRNRCHNCVEPMFEETTKLRLATVNTLIQAFMTSTL